MTLRELWMIIVKKWKLIVVLPVVCALVAGAYTLFTTKTDVTYNAKARIVVNSQLAAVNGIAASNARSYTIDYEDDDPDRPRIGASSDGGTMTVTVSATTVDDQSCIEMANAIANYANEVAAERFADFENPYEGQVEEAVESTEITVSLDFKSVPVGLLAGLFVAICIVVIIDMRKRPVKTAEGVQNAVELPVIEILPAANGERLLANVRFASGEHDFKNVVLVPTGDREAATVARELLEAAAKAEGTEGLSAICAAPLSEGMAAAYAARDADAAVVVVRQWADTLADFESTVAELKLAGATIAGIVFAKEKLVKA